MKVHPGSCHCGGVKFRVTAEIVELTTCDCSLCVKKNAVMTKVPEASLEIVEGSDLLSLYEWKPAGPNTISASGAAFTSSTAGARRRIILASTPSAWTDSTSRRFRCGRPKTPT